MLSGIKHLPETDGERLAPGRRGLRIGDWIADPATNELRRGSDRIRIEPKTMDVLAALAARAGQVVTREELLAAVWPGVVVVDEALSQAIAKLRRALGDDPKAPAYIETISKRGYRLTAAVSPAEDSTPPAAARSRAKAGATLAIVLSIIVGGAWLAVTRDAAVPARSSTADDAEGSWITVSVMPFESLGSDAGHEYFARGIGDSLMTELGRLSGLRLISPAGAAPRARYVVSGSVQRDAETLRINARVVDSRSGEQLWSERFERPFRDLFAVQDDIIRKLAEVLPAKVSEAERLRLAKRHTRSLEAYDHFLRAQALFLVRGERENEEARALYRKAVELDPRFARAYAGLAMTHAMNHRLRPSAEAEPGLLRAIELAETARQIDPDSAEVHWALGFIHAQARHHTRAIEALRRAIEINPSFADAHALMGGIYTYVGEPEKTIPLLRTAMRFKPEGGYLYYLLLGRAYLFEGDLEQALINLRAAMTRNPADLESRIYLAAALAASGDRSGAQWEATEIRALDSSFSPAAWLEHYPLDSATHRSRLRDLLAQAGF